MLNLSSQGQSNLNLLGSQGMSFKEQFHSQNSPCVSAKKLAIPCGDTMSKNSMSEPPTSDRNKGEKFNIQETFRKEIVEVEGIELEENETDQKVKTVSQSLHNTHQNSGNLGKKNSHQNSHHHEHESEGFDELKIPPDWQKATLHAQSRETKPELDQDDGSGGMQPVCECCGYEIKRKKVGLNVDIMDLGFLGSGFPLFYNYIKYCCLMLLSLFLIQGVPNIIINLKGNYCHLTELQVYEEYEQNKHHPVNGFIVGCPKSLLNKMSFANIIDEMEHETDYNFHYSIGAILAQIVLSMLFRRSQRVIEQKVDEDNSTPSDYTIMVENIATDLENTEQSLKQEFEKYGKVMKINLVYDINELEDIEKKLQKVIQNKQKALEKSHLNYLDQEVVKADEQLIQLEHEEHSVCANIIKTKFIGTAFISFETEQQKKNAIDNNPQSKFNRFRSYFKGGVSLKYNQSIYLNDRHLYISEAPEPNDVDWEFAHITTEDKIKSRIMTFLKWAILLIASFSVIFAISYTQSIEGEKILEKQFEIETEESEASSHERFLKQVERNNTDINFLQQLNETVINQNIIYHLNNQTEYQSQRILSSESSSATETTDHSSESSSHSSEQEEIKKQQALVTILSYIISALIVGWNKFALPIIIHKICDHEKWSTKTSMNISFAFKLTMGLFFNTALITFFVEIIYLQNIYAFSGGMIYNEFLVFIFNAVVPSVAWIIDPWKIIQDWKRRKELKKPHSVMTQGQAHQLMEHPSYSMGKRYADIMKTMWFTFFYSPIMPIGTAISLVGLIGYYFTDKYNLLFRRTVKESIGSKLSFEMVELVEYSMIFHTFGQAFFKYFACKNIDVGNCALFIGVCMVVMLLPMQDINEKIFPLESENDPQTYTQVVHTFDTDYDRENPITKKKAIQEFQELRKNHKENSSNNPTASPPN